MNGKKNKAQIIVTGTEVDIFTIENALDRIAGYCEKHERCESGCRLWDTETNTCLVRHFEGPPCDWPRMQA